LGVRDIYNKRHIMRYSKEILEKIVNSSNNYSEVTKKIGLQPFYGNRQTVKKYINLFEIPTNHFRLTSSGGKGKKKTELVDILVENSLYLSTTTLKERLYKEGLKNRCCEICGQDENWMGNKISLILDHINGVNNDNRIENLRIVCPNCNATLPTHGGKNVKHKDKEISKCKCGNPTFGRNDTCVKCSQIKQRKVERPNYFQLIDEINSLGYRGCGKKYGVSDNTIRKWKKYYEK
jgi:hypothetical protein